jgi:FdhD protein
MQHSALSYTRIKKICNTVITDEEDVLAAEEPLEIQLVYGAADHLQEQSITVTMRTPGQDHELATGFLFTEGIIRHAADIAEIQSAGPDGNTVRVRLHPHVKPVLQPAARNFFSNSGCGVCGKAGIAAIFTAVPSADQHTRFTFPAAQLLLLPGSIRGQQRLFEDTGGIHAAALFNAGGALLLLREDIGRHNAVDKVIGAALAAGNIPLSASLLLLSGRAGFELIQKAAMAAIPIIAAVGAPSGMAVKMAHEWNITLIGFLREQRCNIYTGEERILV